MAATAVPHASPLAAGGPCPKCGGELSYRYISLHEKLLLCTADECLYPLDGSEDIASMCVAVRRSDPVTARLHCTAAAPPRTIDYNELCPKLLDGCCRLGDKCPFRHEVRANFVASVEEEEQSMQALLFPPTPAMSAFGSPRLTVTEPRQTPSMPSLTPSMPSLFASPWGKPAAAPLRALDLPTADACTPGGAGAAAALSGAGLGSMPLRSMPLDDETRALHDRADALRAI